MDLVQIHPDKRLVTFSGSYPIINYCHQVLRNWVEHQGINVVFLTNRIELFWLEELKHNDSA